MTELKVKPLHRLSNTRLVTRSVSRHKPVGALAKLIDGALELL